MNFIWDLDGTLLDSYKVITEALMRTLGKNGIEKDEAEVRAYIIRYSVRRYTDELAAETGIDPEKLRAEFDEEHDAMTDRIRLICGAKQTLEALSEAGHRHFVATHRGETAFRALENTGILPLFTEILTAKDGFRRKPDPESVEHLIAKYRLDRNETYYVGDRSLDMECAKNAGIGAILYFPEGSAAEKTGREDITVTHLADIARLFAGRR